MLCYFGNQKRVQDACNQTWIDMVVADAGKNGGEVSEYDPTDTTQEMIDVEVLDKKTQRKIMRKVRRKRRRLREKLENLSTKRLEKAIIRGKRRGLIDDDSQATERWAVPQQCADDPTKYWAEVNPDYVQEDARTKEFDPAWIAAESV